MSKVKSTFACPGCTARNPATFKRPTIFRPTVTKFICYKCGSGVMAVVSVKPGAVKGDCEVRLKLTSVGEELAQQWKDRYVKEQQEIAAKEIENAPAL